MVEYDFWRRFHDLNYFEVRIFFLHNPWIHYLLENIITKSVEKKPINFFFEFFFVFQTNFRQSLVQYHLLARHSHHLLLEYVDFSWNFFCHHKLLGFVDHCVSKMSMIFSSQNSKFVCKIESPSLNTRQGRGPVHFTMLAPTSSLSSNRITSTCGFLDPKINLILIHSVSWRRNCTPPL